MHGYTPDELIGKNVMILHSNKQLKEAKKRIYQIKTKGLWEGEIDHIKKDASVFLTYMSVTLLKDDNKKPIGIMAICRDITEQVITNCNFVMGAATNEVIVTIEARLDPAQVEAPENPQTTLTSTIVARAMSAN